MAKFGPVDVDIAVGYQDGTIRNYLVKNFIAEDGQRVLGVKPHDGTKDEPAVTASPPGVDPILIMFWVGIALLAYRSFGPWSLVIVSALCLWLRQVIKTARREHAKKVVNVKPQTINISDQRS